MFRPPERPSSPGRTKQLLNRALLLSGGLVLLWIAIQLFPHDAPAPPPTTSDEAGTVAQNPARELPTAETPSLLSFGNIAALLLLGGGAAAAVYLHRRRPQGGGAAGPITAVGSYAVGPGQELRLVRCAGEVLLLGVTAGEITLLKSYPGDAFEAAPSASLSAGAAAPQTMSDPHADFANSHFADVLRNYAARYTGGVQNVRTPQ